MSREEATYLGARASARYVAAGARAETRPPSTNAGIEAEATTHGRTIQTGPAQQGSPMSLAYISDGPGQLIFSRSTNSGKNFTSQTLAQALPPEVFSPGGGSPGQMMIVYVKDAQGRITRFIIGPGNDPNALINQGR